MDSSIHRFSKQLILISLITVFLTFGLSYIVPAKFISPNWPFIVGFFFAVTLLVHRFLLRKSSAQQAKFINAFMLSTTIKLLLYLAIILIYVLLNRADAIGFIFTFFSYYLIFTFFEIASILKFLRKP